MAITKVMAELNLPEKPKPGERLLYVALHGLVALVQNGEKIHALMLRMDKEHAYRLGSWLAELDVPLGSHGELVGVRNGGAGLDPSMNPVLRMSKMPDLMLAEVHGSLTLPRPRKIHYFDRGKIQVTAGATHKLVETPATLSGLRVFEYEVEADFSSVLVAGMPVSWSAHKKLTRFDNGSAVSTLHMFDMPAGPVGDDHHVHEFALSSKVLGAPIVIDQAVTLLDEEDTPPPGLAPLELTSLVDRGERVSDVFCDWLRTGVWKEDGAVMGGGCRPCCGASDGVIEGNS
jgi:hypothetical protein